VNGGELPLIRWTRIAEKAGWFKVGYVLLDRADLAARGQRPAKVLVAKLGNLSLEHCEPEGTFAILCARVWRSTEFNDATG
jgi:hypothetical protein